MTQKEREVDGLVRVGQPCPDSAIRVRHIGEALASQLLGELVGESFAELHVGLRHLFRTQTNGA